MTIRCLLGACLIVTSSGAPLAQEASVPPSSLPVKQVTLFTSGVSYTERGGEVEGNAAVPLLFRTGQINDILKSMVLLDARGRVQPASYAARDPISHTLQSFAIDVTQNMTQAQILERLRGARVTVDTNKGAVTGQIVGVEMRQVAGEDGKPITVPYLNILGDNGLTSIRLDAEKTVRLLDEKLNREFRAALGLLASGADDSRRQVMLHFSGDGKRQVRVGYVTEAPLWKMTYRLLLGDKAAKEKPFLQGWALVENTSDDDWQNIRLSLVSGRPVSFIQDLYQPLYIPRPIVAPDIIASPLPQTHGGDLQDRPAVIVRDKGTGVDERKDSESFRRSLGRGGSAGAPGPRGEPGLSGPGGGGFGGGDIGEKGEMAKDPSAIFRESVQAQTSGANAGELFQYNISAPVNLPRQQSAMIPVITKDIEAEKLSLYNPNVDARFPLNAVRIRNNTGLHLKGGPLTLFDEGVYAGDAKMEDIPPGDSRLVSYAVDLAVEGERKNTIPSQTETSLSVKGGVLTLRRRERQETVYTLKAKGDKARTVLIEHPFSPEFALVAPAKATERTATLYRFAVPVQPGKAQTLTVTVERPLSETISIIDSDVNVLAFHANRKDISAKMRETLQQVVQKRRKVQEIMTEIASREGEIGTIMQDQERIRKNMDSLDKASNLYKRYVTELETQENRIQTLRQEVLKLRKQTDDANRDLRVFIDGLTIAE